MQRRRAPPERLVRQPPQHRVTRDTLAPAAPAPPVGFHDPARQDHTIGLETLPGNNKTQFIEAAERGQVWAAEGSVWHVEVFRMAGVGTSIFGRPRHLPGHRRADDLYTLNPEEP